MHTSTALLTDHYELTMVDAALQAGTAHRRSVFEIFARRLSGARRYGVVVGTGRLLEAIERFRFTDAELSFLREQRVVSDRTLDWLADFRFSGHIWGYPEGEVFFPGSPLLTVESSFAEGVLLETLALSILNADSAVGTAASRMVHAAAGKPLAEMGSRRTGEYSAVAAARAAYIAGFTATSNLEAGRSHGIPTMGTAAHSFTLLHDTEREAFAAQVAALGTDTTLLVDTYDIDQGVRTAIDVAGVDLGAVRIDSGDLPVVVRRVRHLLDELGATRTRITVTNDLDEHTVAALAAAPVDSFGVGTSVVVGSGTPTMGMVYKLVAHEDATGAWVSVAKKSAEKASVGGRKSVRRAFGADGAAAKELILLGDGPGGAPEADDAAGREVLVPLIVDGAVQPGFTGRDGIAAARERHRVSVSELPLVAMSLTRGDPAIPTEYR
ncbi:nicotinate phosphoribosyltransferase [Leucobacter chromiiresistens]|uniref:Nicotinate phosphoribosyltransferase n=1 Tax=Leucobacter chromiiresistens TaxID=1079994 RepID=A0A1H1AAT9_9MICO|nr:nicotinate phosphoribosyltransferase [Leucobacter chromiiresistens]SDQ36783.1 nicotinate phosphoribosyltransferase [Leucobacter chromiiresistens]